LINYFGHHGGFDQILSVLERAVAGEEESLDLNLIGALLDIVSKPFIIYHKEFSREYCPKFVELAKKKIRNVPDKSLRDAKREKIEAIIKGIDNLQRRQVSKEEREKETEILRLDVCLMCLKSSFLERRIQGIKELNSIIRNNRMLLNKSLPNSFIIDWMQNNDIYQIIFDQRKTHLQIV
jgi:ubiquitin carboxyl-terminal hydrolase 34